MTDPDDKIDVEKEAEVEAELEAQDKELQEETEKLRKALEEISTETDVPGVDPEDE